LPGVTADALRANFGSKSGRRGHPTNHSFSGETRLNDINNNGLFVLAAKKAGLVQYTIGIKIWTDFSSILSQPMRFQTDRQTPFSRLD